MSQIRSCPTCGGNIVTPAYEGDGAYPVGRMCDCGKQKYVPPAEKYRRERERDEPHRR